MTALVSLLVEVKFSTADYTQARDCAELMRQSSFFRVYRNALRQSVVKQGLGCQCVLGGPRASLLFIRPV